MKIFFIITLLSSLTAHANRVFEVNVNLLTAVKLNFNIAMTNNLFIGPTIGASKSLGGTFGLSTTYFNNFEDNSLFFGAELLRFKQDYVDIKSNGSSVDYYKINSSGLALKMLIGYQFIFSNSHAVILSGDIPVLLSETKNESLSPYTITGEIVKYEPNSPQLYIGYGYKF